ncbi:hypothetical protein CF335_g8156 [Tilletia laevis]|nr:hypothetical protein CF335_g8156 [Tilletia laevis]
MAATPRSTDNSSSIAQLLPALMSAAGGDAATGQQPDNPNNIVQNNNSGPENANQNPNPNLNPQANPASAQALASAPALAPALRMSTISAVFVELRVSASPRSKSPRLFLRRQPRRRSRRRANLRGDLLSAGHSSRREMFVRLSCLENSGGRCVSLLPKSRSCGDAR